MKLATAISGAALLALTFMTAVPAGAQSTEVDRRLDRMEKQLRETRSIVFQGKDTGQPVVVRPEGPDPAVTALQSRLDDIDQSLRRLSGQTEVSNHDLDGVRRTATSDHDALVELRAQFQALTDRLNRMEARLAAPPPAPVAEVAPPQAPPPEEPRRGRTPRGSEATARAQAEPGEVLGGPPTAPAGTSEASTYRNALALQEQGDYAGAAQAWQEYIGRYGTAPRAREARYRLGETLYVQSDYGQAARAYAEALKGWPKSAWAPDAAVKLSSSLAQMGRREEACSVVGEFETRYGATAPAAVKTRAATVRRKAACTAG